MRIWIYIFLIISFSACSLRNKDLVKNTVIDKNFLKQENSEVITLQQNIGTVDSSQANILLTIKPKGVFSYSFSDGFLGEAEILNITANKRSINKSKIESDFRRKNRLSLSKNTQLRQKNVEKQILAKNFSWWWPVSLALIALIFFFGKRYKFF